MKSLVRNSSKLLTRTTHTKTSEIPNTNHVGLKPFESIPGPHGLPFIHNMWRFIPYIGQYDINDLASMAKMNREKYGPLVRFKINDKVTILSLYDADDVESLFRQDDKYPSRRAFVAMKKYRLERPDKYSTGGIVPENGPNWLSQRSLFQGRMLSKSKVSGYAAKLDYVTLETISHVNKIVRDGDLRQPVTVNGFKRILNRWSLNCISSLFLDCDLHTIGEDQINELLRQIDNTLIGSHGTDLLSTKWMTRPDKCKYYQMLVKSQDFLYDFAEKQIDKVIRQGPTEGGSMVRDWLYEDKVSRKDLTSFVMDSFLAGVHTTTYTLSNLFYHLGEHHEIQKLLHKEIDDNRVRHKRNLSMEDVDQLVHLQYCLQETYRLNPVATGTGRLTATDIVIAGYHIPKGTHVVVENETMARDHKYFRNPDSFEPLRWKEYRSCPRNQRPSAFASRPFGLGARSCLGQRIFELEVRIFLARFLQNFHIHRFTKPERQTFEVHTIKNDIAATIAERKNCE